MSRHLNRYERRELIKSAQNLDDLVLYVEYLLDHEREKSARRVEREILSWPTFGPVNGDIMLDVSQDGAAEEAVWAVLSERPVRPPRKRKS